MTAPHGIGVIDPLYALPPARGGRRTHASTRRFLSSSSASRAIDAALEAALAELDRFGVAKAGIAIDEGDDLAHAALTNHPERFFATSEVDPHAGMPELRRLERLARAYGLRAVLASPSSLVPPLPIDDRRFYPVFAKCVELDVAICPSLGVPGERLPMSPQKVERIDPVACFFPELRIVMKEGCEPWQALAVRLMRQHPNLSYATGGLLPSQIPAEVIEFTNGDGAHQVLFASHARDPKPRERFYKELPELGLAPAVWPRFLRGNVARILKLS